MEGDALLLLAHSFPLLGYLAEMGQGYAVIYWPLIQVAGVLAGSLRESPLLFFLAEGLALHPSFGSKV